MNILVVSPCFAPAWSWGGQVRASWSMCRSLVEAGAEVSVVTTNADLHGRVTVPPHRTDGGIRITTAPALPGLDRLGSRYALAPGLLRAMRRELQHAELAVLQGIWTFPMLVAPRACRARGTPYVVCPHGTLEALSLSAKPLRKRIYMRLAQRNAITGAAALQFGSDEERRHSTAAVGEVPAFVWENAVEFPPVVAAEGAALRRRLGLAADTVLVGLSGRLHPRKGFQIVVPALAQCDPSLNLVSFGADEAGYGARIREMARAAGVAERVHFLGQLAGDALQGAYASVDLLAAPSFGESFGNTVVEALGQGTEVLVSDRVPLGSYVSRNSLGGVVASLEPAEWARALEDWRRLKRRFDRDRAARTVRADFGPARKGRELLDHYRRILAGRDPLARPRPAP
jgi:glycosyltransferase involved in cell wall biosynthesis